MPFLLIMLVLGLPLLIVGLSYIWDVRTRRRTGHVQAIDEGDYHRVGGFLPLDTLDKLRGVDGVDGDEDLSS